MIGNDIIDLEIPISPNWNTNRYLNKMFSSVEQAAILNSENLEVSLQLFWSLKEAAYKAHQRRFSLPRKYNPKDFQCEILSENKMKVKATVKIGKYVYSCNSFLTPHSIHSVATVDKYLKFSVKIIDHKKSLQKELLTEYARLFNASEINLHLEKDANNIPFLYLKNQRLAQAFSLTHHGKYAAFAIALMNS